MLIAVALLLVGTGFVLFGDAGKKRLTQIAPNEVVVVSNLLIAIPMNMALLALLPPASTLSMNEDFELWVAMGILAICLGEFGFVSSIRRGEYSLVIPLVSLTPLFAIPIGYLFLGETVGVGALIGAAFAVAGAYLMGTTTQPARVGGGLAPLKAILTDRGAQFMILAVVMSPLIGAAQKMAAPPELALLFITFVMLGELFVFSAVLIARRSSLFALVRQAPFEVFTTGVLWSIGFGALAVANSFAPLAIVATIRLIHPIAALVVGRYVFNERQAAARAFPVVLLVGGVLLALVLN
jgi:drug/metabolite transporter (DMT)-like permease